MDAPLANALRRWDHLKIGAVYTMRFLDSTGAGRGTLVDAQVIDSPGGYPATVLLAFEMPDRSGAATIPLASLAILEPVADPPEV
jgi:hypothetical protein